MAGTLTRLQMANEVLDNMGRSSTLTLRSGTLLSDRVITWLNRAQIRVYREADFLFYTVTSSTVANQSCYELPTNMNALYTLRLDNVCRTHKIHLVSHAADTGIRR